MNTAWTEATPEIKQFLLDNEVIRYENEYNKKEGTKTWNIITNHDGTKITTSFVQKFDFSFLIIRTIDREA